MNEKHNNNGRGIFYGVIGVATLVVAIIGATFAYFTASKTNNNIIKGNAATVTFGLVVERAETTDQTNGGLIPMSNGMVETAVNNASNTVCVDDNDNSVCQIYKITVTNTSSASMFLDGYVTLSNGVNGTLGTATDVTGTTTPLRWAQVFPSNGKYTTVGKTTTGATGTSTSGIDTNWATLANASTSVDDDKAFNKSNICGGGTVICTDMDSTNIIADGTIKGNTYDIINRNYIRTSVHTADATYTRDNDLTSALVFNQYLDAGTATGGDLVKSQEYYIVVWLSETGTNQTVGAEGNATTAEDFFTGVVTFSSAQGGEVSATFAGYTAVQSDTTKTTP